jgi:hypothetical protein
MYFLKTPELFTEADIPFLIEGALNLDAVQVLGCPMVPSGPEGKQFVMDQFNSGKSLVLHAIERFSDKAKAYCDSLSVTSNCNFYLTPATGGTTQGLHTDPPLIILFRAFGNKKYKVVRDGKELIFDIDQGYGILIYEEEPHEAFCEGLSGVISFGIFRDDQLHTEDTRLEGKTLGQF